MYSMKCMFNKKLLCYDLYWCKYDEQWKKTKNYGKRTTDITIII